MLEGHLHLLVQAILVLVNHPPLQVAIEIRQERLRHVVEGKRRPDLSLLQVVCYLIDDIVQILFGVEVLFALFDVEMHPIVISCIVLVVFVLLWYFVIDLLTQHHSCLIGPAPRYILDGVAATTQQHHGHIKRHHILQTFSVAFD